MLMGAMGLYQKKQMLILPAPPHDPQEGSDGGVGCPGIVEVETTLGEEVLAPS